MIRTDIIILGGGLAGLSTALHLKKSQPELGITILERETHPLREAAHKVGESTVELSAFYFSEVLGLRDHLLEQEFRKLGLRVFFTDGSNRKIENRLEFGANQYFPSGTFQIDRGRFENFLAKKCQEAGVDFRHSVKIRDVHIRSGKEEHSVRFDADGEVIEANARWVVDASGRAAILKRELGLTQPSPHPASAAWFRFGRKIDINDWSDDEAWKKHNQGEYSRWFSTNHLMGSGYWVWIIPLASNATSVGIVADPRIHPLSEFNTLERAYEWLLKNEPQCGEELSKYKDEVLDFIAIKHYSHRCTQVFSEDRWAITGDAGFFLDPFYSPGSDFISIANTFIVDLIKRDYSDGRFESHTRIYNELFIQLANNTFQVFENQYPIFGDPVVMPVKIIWDYSVYWAYLAFVFIQNQLCNLSTLVKVRNSLAKVEQLNGEMQQFFLRWYAAGPHETKPHFIDLAKISSVFRLNAQLRTKLTDDEFVKRLNENVDFLCALRDKIVRDANLEEGMNRNKAALNYFEIGQLPL